MLDTGARSQPAHEANPDEEAWPALPLGAWQDTYAALHLCTQLLGKTRLALSAPQNHWWHTALYPTARGLTTSAMPYDAGTLDVELDVMRMHIVARTSDGAVRELDIGETTIADVYAGYRTMLASLGVELDMWPQPVEIEGAIPFPADDVHAIRDAAAVRRCWQVLRQSHDVIARFRSRFIGKCSPVHFWWGAFDLACTRFSGRGAPQHPGGVPNLADHVAREAYSHECISAGWWPGTIGGPLQEPAFYAYVYPEPVGCASAPVEPTSAYWDDTMREWVLPYDAMRRAPDPEAALTSFLESTYAAGADLAGWDRAALERRE